MVTSMLSEEHIPSRGILWDFKRHVAPRLIKLCCPNASVQLGRKDQYEAERRNFVDLCQHHPPTKVGHCSWSLLTCGEDRKCAAQQHPPHCTIVPNQFVSGRMGDRFAFAGNLTDAPVPERIKQIREGPMTTAGQAFLFAGEVLCLSFAVIALVYFAERLRSDFLDKP